MPLWFLPLAKGLAHEEVDAVSQDFLDLFRAYSALQRVLEGNDPVTLTGYKNCDNCEFSAESGWKFLVFNDCSEWDYIDDILTPDGQSLKTKFGWDYMEQHGTIYAPTDDDLQNIWGWKRSPLDEDVLPQ